MADFPSYTFTGKRPRREIELAPDWKSVTDDYEFEDGGHDFNERSDAAPVRWEYVVDGFGTTAAAARDDVSVYHDFWNTYRLSQPFNFTDKYGVTWANVHIESYSRTHSEHKSWQVTCSFNLVSYKGEKAPSTPGDLTITDESGESLTIEWTASTE